MATVMPSDQVLAQNRNLPGLKEDHTREVSGIVNIPQESASGWQKIPENIHSGGVQKVSLFVFDGLTGLDHVIGKVFSDSLQQKYMLHFQRNLNKHIRKAHCEDFCKELKDVFNPDEMFYTTEQGVNNQKAVPSK